MAGHSRPKDGVASLAYVPAIHALLCKPSLKAWMPGTRPGMTVERSEDRQTALSQPKWIGKPSPDSSVAVSYSGSPTTLV